MNKHGQNIHKSNWALLRLDAIDSNELSVEDYQLFYDKFDSVKTNDIYELKILPEVKPQQCIEVIKKTTAHQKLLIENEKLKNACPYTNCISSLEVIMHSTKDNKQRYLEECIEKMKARNDIEENFKKYIVAVFQKRTGLTCFSKATTTGKQLLDLLKKNVCIQAAFKAAYPAMQNIDWKKLSYKNLSDFVLKADAQKYIVAMNEHKISEKTIDENGADKSFTLYRLSC